MRKLIFCSLIAIVLSNCEIRTQQASSQIVKTLIDSNGRDDIYIYRYVVDSIEYHIVNTGSHQGGTSVINLTKDKLEIELLKKQLK